VVRSRNKIVGAPTWILKVVVNIVVGTTRRAAVANGAGMVGLNGERRFKARVGAAWRLLRPGRGGALLNCCARPENVGAPTWILDVVVTMGAGTTRRAAVANSAGMAGVRGEKQFTVDS